MKKIWIVFLTAIYANGIIGQITYPIVDTDVQEFYSDIAVITKPKEGQVFYGQDAHYSGNQPSYTDNGNGTVTDNVTGLMWQQDPGSKMSYAEAVLYAKTMNLGDYTDWRIPSIKELYSLVYFTGRCQGENVIDKFIDTDYFVQPIGNTSFGEREIDAQTWSKTHYVHLTMKGDSTIFGFNFVDGRLKGYPKYSPKDATAQKMYFRMVRGNEKYGINKFTDNGDGTITDAATGLMWQQADNGNTYDWESGLSYAEGLTLAGYSDWRMPNAKELQSIVDYSRSPATTSSPAINPLFSCTEFSDPDGKLGQYGYYWTSSPLKDGSNPYSDAVYVCFGKAQGKMETPPNSGNFTLLDVHGAGAQRNDTKSGKASDYPDFHGPQGDVVYVYNFVRCVRNASGASLANVPVERKNISVYPIPASTELNISAEELYTIRLINVLGKELQTIKMRNKNTVLNLSGLPTGTYILQFSSFKEAFVKKIVKQ